MKKGGPCPWPVDRCPVEAHARWRRGHREADPPARPAPLGPAPTPGPEPPGLQERDLRTLAWWLIAGILRGDADARQASVVVSLMRTLAALGPAGPGEEEALREVELRGRLMHGLPPRNEEEWARAGAAFTPDALAEFRRWAEELLLESDGRDRLEPLYLRERGAGHVHVPLLVDREDGV